MAHEHTEYTEERIPLRAFRGHNIRILVFLVEGDGARWKIHVAHESRGRRSGLIGNWIYGQLPVFVPVPSQ